MDSKLIVINVKLHLCIVLLIFSNTFLLAQKRKTPTIGDSKTELPIPHVSSEQRSSIKNPGFGLMVYDVTTRSFWLYNTHTWEELQNFKTSVSLPFKNVVDFGAKGNGEDDDTEAIRNALVGGGEIYFPRGEYLVSQITLEGSGLTIHAEEATIKSNSKNNLDLFIMKNLLYSKIYLGKVVGTGASGDLFKISGRVNHNIFTFHQVNQPNPNSSILAASDKNGATLFFNKFEGIQWIHANWKNAPLTTVAAIKVVGKTNICSNNSWTIMRADNPKGLFIHFECTTSGFFYNNTISQIGVEQANNGFMYLKRCGNMSIENITYYDNSHGDGILKNDLLTMDICRNVLIQNVIRNSGKNPNGFKDIKNGTSKNTTILSCGGVNPIGVYFDLGNQNVNVLSHFNTSLLKSRNAKSIEQKE